MKPLKDFVSQEAKVFKNLSKKTKKNPAKKKVHKLRVSIRKMRTILKEDGDLKKLSNALGKVRDLDVAIENTKLYEVDPTNLKLERKASRKKLQKKLEKRKTINKELKKPKIKPSPQVELIEELKSWSHPLKDDDLHPFRKTVKEIRYVLEASGRKTDYLRNLQSELGKVHDLAVLASYYEKNLSIEKDRKKAATRAKKLIPKTIQQALKQLRELT